MMIPFVMMMAAEQRKRSQQHQQSATMSANGNNLNGNSSSSATSSVSSSTAATASASSAGADHSNLNGNSTNSANSTSTSTSNKSPNSSSETVIARLDVQSESVAHCGGGGGAAANGIKGSASDEAKLGRSAPASEKTTSEQSCQTSSNMLNDQSEILSHSAGTTSGQQAKSKRNSSGRLKNLLLLANHLNPFHHHQHQPNGGQKRKSLVDLPASASSEPTEGTNGQHQKQRSLLNLLAIAQRYFGASHSASRDFLDAATCSSNAGNVPGDCSKSAPVTPVKWAPLVESVRPESGGRLANGYLVSSARETRQTDATRRDSATSTTTSAAAAAAGKTVRVASAAQATGSKPSVRFVEGPKLSQMSRCDRFTADCGMQTDELDEEEDEEEELKLKKLDGQTADLVAKLFKIPELNTQTEGEVPMDSTRFRQYGYKLIDYISTYLDTIGDRRVTPLNIEPGYLKSLIQPDAPEQGDTFANIMHDFENHIMCGITHWQHPHFHAYFPAGNAYPSILADMLSDALGCVGFSWAASPAYTELEIIMLDWMGKMIGLPDEFLCLSGSRANNQESSKGGGVIQGSASECVLVNLLAARHWAIERLRKKYGPELPDGMILSKLIGYCSKEAHSCVEKAAMIGFIRMRALDTDERHSLRGDTLRKAMETDMANGLEPFIVCATLGTTSCVSFDNLEELGQVCAELDVWLHVDAAYAGSALICPEFKYLMKGIEMASSFNMNPNKWMLINFDCSLMWVKDRFKLTRAFVVDPLYLQHSFSDQAIDYRHWGIPLSRRFRALKLWFVIRNYGVEGLRSYIRNHVRLAKLFESYIRQDSRFMITNQVVLGLVCFRLIGSNALNQRLLSMINASGKLHMVPASLNGRYVIRFCVCDQHAVEKDILYAYRCVADFATELFESIRAGKERIRAISQQNTIDVSSISLHTQQSASADKLAAAAAGASGSNSEPPSEQSADQSSATTTTQQVAATSPVLQRIEAARQYLLSRRSSRGTTNGGGGEPPPPPQSQTPLSPLATTCSRSPLTKQVSVQPQQQVTAANGNSLPLDDEDLEQEIILDSLATLDGCGDYDLDLEDEEDFAEVAPPNADLNKVAPTTNGQQEPADQAQQTGGQPQMDAMDSRSPVARRWHSRASRTARNQTLAGNPSGEHDAEAEDEVFTLAERRNRMSLRYKREFFVRVVSDPRVYRASISGDINAHASCCSLGGAAATAAKAVGAKQPNATANVTSDTPASNTVNPNEQPQPPAPIASAT